MDLDLLPNGHSVSVKVVILYNSPLLGTHPVNIIACVTRVRKSGTTLLRATRALPALPKDVSKNNLELHD